MNERLDDDGVACCVGEFTDFMAGNCDLVNEANHDAWSAGLQCGAVIERLRHSDGAGFEVYGIDVGAVLGAVAYVLMCAGRKFEIANDTGTLLALRVDPGPRLEDTDFFGILDIHGDPPSDGGTEDASKAE